MAENSIQKQKIYEIVFEDGSKQYLDEEEWELEQQLERDEWVSSPNLEERKAEAIQAAKNTLKRDQRLNIRLNSLDMRSLKYRAAKEGIPYQTLAALVIHKLCVRAV